MSKIWLNIFLLLTCLPLSSYSQDCDCIDCPSNIVDADTTEIVFRINNIDNNSLSSPDQGVCEVFLKFNHSYIGDLTMDLISPAGQAVTLIGPHASASPTFLASFNLTFLPCAEPVMPDPGNPSNWNNTAINGLGNYSGSYYPFQGCLENFNTGSVAGDWILQIVDHENFDSGQFSDLFITFCDPSGIDCCKANAGTLPPDESYCVGDPALLLDIEPSYTGNPPSTSAHGYSYIITENDLIIGLEDQVDMTSFPTGTYGICGISYALEDVPFLPVPDGTININTVIALVNASDPLLCADITDVCMEIQILDPPMEQFETADLCKGDTIFFGSNTIVDAGQYKDTLTSIAFCDSIVNLEVTLRDTFQILQMDFSCDPTLVGLDTMFLSSIYGCDSTVITEIVFQDSDTTFIFPETCDASLANAMDTTSFTTDNCDSIVISTFNYLAPDTNVVIDFTCMSNMIGISDTMNFTTEGCDSVVITNYELISTDTTFQVEETCDPELLTVSDTMSFATATCDSLVITTFTLLDLDTTYVELPTCDPDQEFQIDSTVFTTSTCDSLVITSYLFQNSDTTFLDGFSCVPEEVGSDTMHLTNVQNCDSIVITITAFAENDTTFIPMETCDPNLVGEEVETFPTALCDSVVITTYTELPKDTSYMEEPVCILPNEPTDTTFFTNQFGCDSLVISNFVLLDSDTIFLEEQTCDPVLVGMDTVRLSNQNNCDSLVITTFQLSESDTTNVTEYSCLEEEVGTMTETFSTALCDSVVITTTLFLDADTTFQQMFTCDENNLEPDTIFLQNQDQCDSLVITTFTLSENDTTEIMRFSCLEEETGITTDIFETAFCDSVVITTTLLLDPDTMFQQLIVCAGNSLEPDTMVLQNQNLCDSLIITNYIPRERDTTFTEANTCKPEEVGMDTIILNDQFGCDSIIINTNILTAADTTWLDDLFSCNPEEIGMDTVVFENENCDSIVIGNTIFTPLDSTILSIPICEGEDTTSQIETLISSQGCDSVIVFSFFTLEVDTSFQTNFTQIADEAGIDTLVLESSNGCDSIVINTIIFQENIPDTLFTNQNTCSLDEVGIDTITIDADSVEIVTFTYVGSEITNLENFVCTEDEAGIDSLILENGSGCDSLIITNNIFEGPIETLLMGTTCLEDEVGLDTTVLTSTQGCDSLVIVDNVLVDAETKFFTEYVCGLEEMYFDTMTFVGDPCPIIEITNFIPGDSETTFVDQITCEAEGFTETIILENSNACDSVIIVEYNSVLPDTTFVESGSCKEKELGIFTEVLSSQFGCDSVVVTSVSFQEIDTLYNFIPTCNEDEISSDTVLVSTADCDQIEITELVFEAIPNTIIDSITCIESDAGIFSTVFQTPAGCDSTVIINLDWVERFDTIRFQEIVCSESLVGIDTVTMNNSECPEIEITEYLFEPTNDTTFQELASCDSDLIGTISIDNFPSQDGCDSIVLTTFVEGEGEINYLLTTTPVSCFGASDGSVAFEIFSSGITINWSDGFIESVRNELAAGDYFITLSNGACEVLEKATIESPPRILSSVQSVIEECTVNGGTLLASAENGTAPYDYLWSSGQEGDFIDNLEAGMYFVTITDDEGCTTIHQASVDSSPPLELDIEVEHLTCFASDNGSIETSVISGTPPLLFEWNTLDNTQNLVRLDPGTYSVTVTDDNDCRFETTIEVLQPDEIVASFVEEEDLLTVQVEGGVPGYTYLWNTGETTGTINNLTIGDVYMVTITDATGCEVVEEYLLTDVSESRSLGNDLIIYPNPSTGTFYFENDAAQGEHFIMKIFNALGQEQLFDLDLSTNSFDLHASSPGTYMLYVNMGENFFWKKLIINK